MIIRKTEEIGHKEFKETEMGMIPKEWKTVTLREICEMERGFSYKSEYLTQEKSKKEFITINNLDKEGGLKDTDRLYLKDIVKVDERFHVNRNDLFIANTDMAKGYIIGAPILIKDRNKNCIFSMDLTRLLLKNNDLITDFLFYLLLCPKIRNFMKRNAQGTNVLHLNHQFVALLIIPLPPLLEQKKIVEVLLTIDHSIKEIDEFISKSERLKKRLMQELLTKGIGHKEFKETEIGLLPSSWNTKKNFIKIKSGYGFKFEEYSKKGIPLIRIDNVQYGKIDYENLCYLPENYLKKYKDFVLKRGEIILALNRPITNNELKIGKIEIEPSILYQRIGIIKINEEGYDINFYYHYLRSHLFLRKLKSILVGSDQPYIKLEIFSKISFPKPPLKEQELIADILSIFDSRINLLREKKNKFERVKKGLMYELLTGRKRVKVEI